MVLIFHPPNRFPTRTKALPLCLTKKEIRELTLKMHHSAQVRTLAEMGVPFIVRPDGSPGGPAYGTGHHSGYAR